MVFISAILQILRTNCHYLGTAGRGQVNRALGGDRELRLYYCKRMLVFFALDLTLQVLDNLWRVTVAGGEWPHGSKRPVF
jgi:hypothetical protein